MLIQQEDLLPNYLINKIKKWVVGFFCFQGLPVIYPVVAIFTVITTSFVGPLLAHISNPVSAKRWG